MAAIPALGQLIQGDFLHCKVCSNNYNMPRLLPCLHSVCNECLYNNMQVQTINAKIPCPVCSADIPITKERTKSFKVNNFLKNLQELAECQNDELKACDYCVFDKKHTPALNRCLECQDSMCEDCTNAHRRTKVTRLHKVAPFSEIKMGKYDSDIRSFQQTKCEAHPSEAVSVFCSSCDELVCKDCRIGLHEGHQFSELPKVGQRYRQQMESLVQGVKSKIPGIDQYSKFLAEYHSHVQNIQTKVRENIEKQAASLHTIVDSYKESLLRQLESVTADEQVQVSTSQQKIQSTLNTYKSTVEYLEKLLEFGNPGEILTVRKMVTDRLTQLVYLHIEGLSTKLSSYFTPGDSKEENIHALFGKVDYFNIPLNDDAIKSITKGEIQINTALPTVGESVELVQSFDCKGKSDMKDMWPSGIAINKKGNIVILDRENKKVKTFDPTGQLLHEFGEQSGPHSLKGPYSLAVMRDGNICVTDHESEDIKIFTPDGKHVLTIEEQIKYPRGICESRDGKLLAVDCHNRNVLKFNAKTGILDSIIDGKDEDGLELFTDPYYITTNTKDYVIVTDWAAPNVKIFSPDGKYLTKYGTYGIRQHQVLQPYGVCTDAFGYIFVADHQNHRVHLLAPDGKFLRFLISKQNGLWHPMAVTINHHGHLLVTEALGKIKVFKYL